MNVRYSTTLKSEGLTDAQCVNRLQTGITKAVIEIKTAARYKKGYGMLEPYAVKVARTVLRRGRTSNRSSLFDSEEHNKLIIFQSKEIRRTWFNDEWWFVIKDVIATITESANPSDYLKKLRKRDGSLDDVFKGGGTNCPPPWI